MTTIVNADGSPTGVRFSGYYFGDSGITVMADIYSSSGFSIDFYINDSASAYSAEQLTQRQKVLNLAESIHALINNVDSAANTQYDGKNGLPLSDIYRYNQAAQGEKLNVSSVTYEMLQIAKEMYAATNKAFNPATYRLVDLWGFSSRIYSNGNFGLSYDRKVTSDEFWKNGYPLPEDKYVKAFSNPDFTDFSDAAVTLSRENGQCFVTKNVAPAVVDGEKFEQWLDLGGIAKGYAVDYIKQMLSSSGIDRYNVDAGSSSMAFGRDYKGGSANMSIPDPFDKRSALFAPNLMAVEVQDCSVSTSGQYVRKYTTNGVEYSHIVDGKTGEPAQTGVKLVTVIAPEGNFWAGKGDCLTTALTVMGKDGIVDFMNGYLKDNGIEVIVLYRSEKGVKQVLSNMKPDEVTKLSDAYDSFAWATAEQNGKLVYVDNSVNSYLWIVIVLAVAAVLGVVAIVVYHVVKGKRKALDTVRAARKDKPFKIWDIAVYAAVVLVIAALFGVFFGIRGNNEPIRVIKIVDTETQQILFSYDVSGNDEPFVNSTNGWAVTTESDETEIRVTLKKTFGSDERFNTVQIKLGGETSVLMLSSRCGFGQDCVRNFDAITQANGAIVCSPNRIKVITE